jgi:hypothetical protein
MPKEKKPRKNGPATTYKPEYCEQLVEHCKDGSSLNSFAVKVGVAGCTLNYWAEQFPEFKEAHKRAMSASLEYWEKLAKDVANGTARSGYGKANPTMIIFVMKSRFKEYREKTEIALPEEYNGPIQLAYSPKSQKIMHKGKQIGTDV